MTIAAALNAQPRGAFLDVSMTDAVLSAMGWVVSNYLIANTDPAAHGNENTTSAPSGTFATADQPINIAANRDEQWVSLALHIGRPELLDHPNYVTRDMRKAHRHALRHEIDTVLSTRPADDWVAEFNAIGVPSGPVLSVPQVLDDAQIAQRDVIATVSRDDENIKVMTGPAIIDGEKPMPTGYPPSLGEHNHEVWGELGLSAKDMAALQEEGIL